MAFPPRFLDDLRLKVSLASVIGKKVKLTKRGNEYIGLCPFHKEKTPSFTLNEEKGFYHCFGCGAHGDAISFLINCERLSFMEAVEHLAQMAGMEVPKSSPQEAQKAAASYISAGKQAFFALPLTTYTPAAVMVMSFPSLSS